MKRRSPLWFPIDVVTMLAVWALIAYWVMAEPVVDRVVGVVRRGRGR